MHIRQSPSPNHDARPAGMPVDILLLHYTDMRSCAEAVERLRDPAARVSAHYCIAIDGTVHALVPEDRRAWHAGVSSWAGAGDVNGRSIGIELDNPGHQFGYRPFTEAQMQALIELCLGILERHPIPAHRVLGHSDVAPARKIDPGELFNWRRMAAAGIGLWPDATGFADPGAAETADAMAGVQSGLARFGYDVGVTGVADSRSRAALAAFQRHFHPCRITGEADGGTRRMLAALIAQLPFL
ncbi:MAG: N-acetylmuramoyl-L-alanine amidase [Dongiaceae bacterium]